MIVTVDMHRAAVATAYDTADGTQWLTFKSSDGSTFSIFMPFEKAEAIADIFNTPATDKVNP